MLLVDIDGLLLLHMVNWVNLPKRKSKSKFSNSHNETLASSLKFYVNKN